jgi:hypothetical protein
MMIKHIGSQNRELIGETTYKVVGVTQYDEVILEDEEGGDLELWAPNDHHSGYTIEIAGIGYEFTTSIKREDLEQYRA